MRGGAATTPLGLTPASASLGFTGHSQVSLNLIKASIIWPFFIGLSGITHAEYAAPANESLPRILLIGDSISGGYQKQVKHALEGKAVVVKNEVEINCLYNYILPDLENFFPSPDNVHFTGSGCGRLAQKVVSSLGATLAKRADKP